MEYPISGRAAALTPSMTLAIAAKAKAMKAAGEDVIGFGAGEPDFDTPEPVKDAAAAALKAGFTKYTPAAGIPELRQAIADKFKRENGLDYDASKIVVSCGGKHTCYNIMLAVCDAGDEVIIPAPYWVSYPEMAKLVEARPVIIETRQENNFKLTAEVLRAAITPRSRLLILNTPSNPTGSVYSPEETKAIADVCLEHDVLILSDEIYEHLLYDGVEHCSAASFGPEYQANTIIAHGFAKAWSMTGWRLGFCAAPVPIAKAIAAIQSHSTSNPVSFAQKGGLVAIAGDMGHLPAWLKAFDERRRYAYETLTRIDGITVIEPKGAFYIFPDISASGLDSATFCTRLLDEQKVAAVPGVAFGADRNIRLSYATDLASIKEGLARLDAFCHGL